MLSGRRAEALRSVTGAARARIVVADLAEPGEVGRLAKEAGPVDILPANAALPASGGDARLLPRADRPCPRRQPPRADPARPAARTRDDRGRAGQVVLVGSLSGKAASPVASLYNATTFGLRDVAQASARICTAPGPAFPWYSRASSGTPGCSPPPAPPRPVARTVSPAQVATAIVRAIEQDRAEINVVSVELRLGGAIGGCSPASPGTCNGNWWARTSYSRSWTASATTGEPDRQTRSRK
ncbi:oxidoreductase [Amycolatopsis cihanbeyliensis]|uniref:Short-subunit dehydrogenase n=1 Tax=Amycolatopsis cihanbeyliensis TaxID=1128664 RepID=A0A542DGI0_AMYCI|nr:oxidoreductase [Amycolatopsis cihanbeyliensis]TQJ02176.1 short-subunit dehydrogenase [Amycolatopsis cihanbeyliensis]